MYQQTKWEILYPNVYIIAIGMVLRSVCGMSLYCSCLVLHLVHVTLLTELQPVLLSLYDLLMQNNMTATPSFSLATGFILLP